MEENAEQWARRWVAYPVHDLTKDERSHAAAYRGVLAKLDAARADLVASAQTAAQFQAERDALDEENLRLREQAGDMAIELDAARARIAELEKPQDLSREPFAQVVVAAVAWCEHGTSWARDELQQAVRAYLTAR